MHFSTKMYTIQCYSSTLLCNLYLNLTSHRTPYLNMSMSPNMCSIESPWNFQYLKRGCWDGCCHFLQKLKRNKWTTTIIACQLPMRHVMVLFGIFCIAQICFLWVILEPLHASIVHVNDTASQGPVEVWTPNSIGYQNV